MATTIAKEVAHAIPLREFLEQTPPGKWTVLKDIVSPRFPGETLAELPFPELLLHCETESCGGIRHFSTSTKISISEGSNSKFCFYKCKNCGEFWKHYSLLFRASDNFRSIRAYKYGELPTFGPPTPRKVQKILGDLWPLFLKGRQAENQSMGIAAFAYYRRVVEAQRNVILNEIVKVAKLLKAAPEMIADLEAAQAETQFTKSVDAIKHGIPQSLYLDGHNPLTLLHDALSDGLHNESDDDCLELATAIRLVLIDLVERLSLAMAEHEDLKSAVTKLVSRKSKQV